MGCEQPAGMSWWGTRGSLTAVVVGIAVALWVSGGQGPRSLKAQGARRAPRVAATDGAHRYRQVAVVWTRMEETLNDWESKGWETFEIVPVANPNPASGAPMQVAIVFRTPARAGD